VSYNPDIQTIKEGLFRFGQWFSATNIKFSYYRDPISNLLCKGVIDDAMAKGYDLVKQGTEELVDWNDEFQKMRTKHFREFKQTIYFQRRNGISLHAFSESDGQLISFAGALGQYMLDYDANGNPTKGVFDVPLINYAGMPSIDLDATKDNFIELIIDRKENINEGMSVLEPVWDVLFAIYMLVSHSAYFIARAGAGLKKAKIPESAMEADGSLVATMVTMMTEFGSASDTIILPESLGGVPIDFSIETIDTAVDFNAILELYLTIISAHTGIPLEALRGAVSGQLSGAELNESSYFDFLRDLQDSYHEYTIWWSGKLIEFYGFPDEAVDILWKVRKVISEDDEIKLLSSKADLVSKLKKIGIKTIKAIEMSKIGNITDADLKDGVDEPIQIGTNAQNPVFPPKSSPIVPPIPNKK